MGQMAGLNTLVWHIASLTTHKLWHMVNTG